MISFFVASYSTVCWYSLYGNVVSGTKSFIALARTGYLLFIRASRTDRALVSKTIAETASDESMIKETAFMSASVSVLNLLQCFPGDIWCVNQRLDGCVIRIPAPPAVIARVTDPSV